MAEDATLAATPASGVSAATDDAMDRETESDLITATLAWSARRFGANASRFVRPTNSGAWLVVTWMNESISVHQADPAECAMAWMVALGRQRLLVSKPRVSAPEGGDVRPISARNYLGVPVICHDRILGVIEVAGDLRSDIESAASAAQVNVDHFALRLAFDTALQTPPAVEAATIVSLGPGIWLTDEASISQDELRFAAAVTDTRTIAEIAAAIGLNIERAVKIACSLERRGLIEVGN
jgi:hypothetical protein